MTWEWNGDQQRGTVIAVDGTPNWERPLPWDGLYAFVKGDPGAQPGPTGEASTIRLPLWSFDMAADPADPDSTAWALADAIEAAVEKGATVRWAARDVIVSYLTAQAATADSTR